MKPICETVAQYVLPAIRAIIARDLIECHHMTQKEAAKKLGMTQPAVSQYGKHTRGTRAKVIETDSEISKMVTEISQSLAKGEINLDEATERVCDICKHMRKRGLIQKMH